MNRVLLITASFGDGHNQAAFAVREALEKSGASVRVVDYVEWLHPALRSVAKFSLIQGVQKIPVLYGLFYRSMSKIEPSSQLQRHLNQLGISHMKRWLKMFDPDVVVSTFPVPNGVMSELRETGFTNVPNVAIVTDYTAHRQWVHEHTDMYYVATDSVKRELISAGVRSDRIQVTGIPVRAKFDEDRVTSLLDNRNALRQKHGLDVHRPLIMMMGGGAGLLGDSSAWENVIRQTEAQFCIVCGRNERLFRRMHTLESQRVRVLGYTNEVDLWMAMSDLIVTKAGGITVTEAFAMELPMLLYRPIPGQEERNAKYAVQCGAAELAYDLKTAVQFVSSVIENPAHVNRMKEAAKAQHVRGGADRIAKSLQNLAEKWQASRNRDDFDTRDSESTPLPHYS